jgi:type I restriction enzyme M protein
MIGAIVGDIVGSRFEWHNLKSKDFELFVAPGPANWKSIAWQKRKAEYGKRAKDGKMSLGALMAESGSLLSSSIDTPSSAHPYVRSERPCKFTDDTVMTLAVAAALMDWKSGGRNLPSLPELAVRRMQEFGRRYPRAGYGGHFRRWLTSDRPQPYNSWGNGSAMRVSACGWAGRSVDEVKAISRAVTEVTHNHPEGVKGAEATAVATFLARTGSTKDEIRDVVVRDYYPLGFTLDEIRPRYGFDVSCQGSVPQALEAFLESTSFEDAIRNAISIGGDSDTIGAIAGAVAGAHYGVPDGIREKAVSFLDPFLVDTLGRFESLKFEV